jgi:branched-subunit amino acid aminotransferase/4-amino-4-deoxychorismate lyase
MAAPDARDTCRDVCWVEGRIQQRSAPAVPVDDAAYSEGRGCYSSVRIEAGRPRYVERHLRRLARGARALDLGRFDPERARQALRELGAAAFPDGHGIIRLQITPGPQDRVRLVGIPRALGADPPAWTVIRAPLLHEGSPGGHKLTQRVVHALAARTARRAGADEALLFDRAGRLVEASRSNVVVLRADGTTVTPPLERGAVAGVARELLCERRPEIRARDVTLRTLRDARAVACTNAVRGVRPVVRLDGRPLSRDDGWTRWLKEALDLD